MKLISRGWAGAKESGAREMVVALGLTALAVDVTQYADNIVDGQEALARGSA